MAAAAAAGYERAQAAGSPSGPDRRRAADAKPGQAKRSEVESRPRARAAVGLSRGEQRTARNTRVMVAWPV